MRRLPTYDQYSRIETLFEAKAIELEAELAVQGPVDESIAVGAALALPATLELAGHFLTWLGHRHSDTNVVTRVGHTLERFGSDLQNSLLRLIQIAMKPFTFWMNPSDQETAAKALLVAFLSYKIMAVPGAVVGSGLSNLEAAIAAIDTKEIVTGIKSIGPKLVKLLQ